MRTLSLIGVLTAALSFGAEVPRQSPEFVINYPSGEKQLLSKTRGKVVLVEFLYTTCSHCQHAAGVLSKYQADYGARGFQAIGIGFNEMSNMLVPDFIRDFKPTFPVGWANREPVMVYLGMSPEERFVVPQLVLIDRKGVIRAQSTPLDSSTMQDEKFMRAKIEELLTGTTPPRQPSSAVKSPAAAAPRASAAAGKPSTTK